jgi:hypothetical protein
MQAKSWNKDVMAGGLGISPGLETTALLIMCWIVAPIDVFLRWMKAYREAEEARRRQVK